MLLETTLINQDFVNLINILIDAEICSSSVWLDFYTNVINILAPSVESE